MAKGDQEQKGSTQTPEEVKQLEASDKHDHEGQADLARCPSKPASEWLYKNIEDVSKNAAKVYLVFMGFLTYIALIAVSTPDRILVLNDKVHLPIMNIDVSADCFFVIAPLLVILIFLYLQMYIQRRMRLVDRLRQQYGCIEVTRIYPWIMNLGEYPDRGFVGELQRLVVSFCIWIVPVIVLNIISLSYIRKHAPYASYAVAALALLGTLAVACFWWADTRRRSGWRHRVACLIISVLIVFEGFVLFPFIPWAHKGGVKYYRVSWLPGYVNCVADHIATVKLSFQKLVAEPGVDYEGFVHWQDLRKVHLEGADLYSSILKRADLSGACLDCANLSRAILEGINLRGAVFKRATFEEANLKWADLTYAFLRWAVFWKADLRKINLQEAYLREVIFWKTDIQDSYFQDCYVREAIFWKADLRGARGLTASQLSLARTLYGTKLDPALMQDIQDRYPRLLDANLENVNLQGANLREEDLKKTSFQEANLKEANLWGADLQEADLRKAHLQRAILRKADLRKADLRKAELQGANLQGAFLQGAYLQEADLEDANFMLANLQGANLQGTNLKEGNFRQTNLQEADLQSANLEKAHNLTIDQLAKAKTLYEAKLDEALLKEVRAKYPHLLQKPNPQAETKEKAE